jgi:anti-sigma factor RsiW
MKCKQAQRLLSEYIDNTLSARDTWEVDRHLAACHECARLLNEMRRAVDALAAAPRFEVSTDFMERLQSRIENLRPEPARKAWLASLREMFRPRALPAWGAAAAFLVAAVLLLPRSQHGTTNDRFPLPLTAPFVQTANNQNVALAASDPFGDMAAANLAASSAPDAAAESETAH